MPALPDIARATVAEHALLPPGTVVLAMVSGGADSVALLSLLASGELGELEDLSVLHVDHMLREDDSTADAEFVRALCDELGVACTVVRYDVAAYAAEEGLNIEDAGRRIRYRFSTNELDARCVSLGVSPLRGRIAVAHTLDDRLETFLMRFAAGSGATGLRAIAYARERIVRPLLDARRAEVEAYLRALGRTWREDATNADTERSRAWVRHELMPLLESRNPRFGDALGRTIDILSEEDELLAEMADAFARDFAYREGGRLCFRSELMETLSRPMARRTVRAALFAAFPEASRIEFDHVEAVVDGIGADGFARDLPFGLQARAEYGTLVVSRRGDEPTPIQPCPLDVPGTCDLGASGRVEARLVAPDAVRDDPLRAYADARAIAGPLVVDRCREGDRMRPFGMQGTKKLSDLLTDAKVPRAERAVTPIVRCGDEIVWVAGVRSSEDFRVRDGAPAAVELIWHREQQ
ncbi:MAG: tRNA lysidine(34) synthetase TilS [Coriobacteriia bacterium]